MAECIICGQAVGAWLAHPHLEQTSGFIKAVQTVGSDLLNYQCPNCGCTDRDRHLWLYLQAIGLPNSLSGARILHLAPEAHLERRLDACRPAEYVRGDLYPSRPNQLRVDLERMEFPDDHFDLIICNHVLEHVSDPDQALAECWRCLQPGALLIAQTPYAPLLKQTLELTVTPTAEFATLFFGQDDHVRLFGSDLEARIQAAGFRGNLVSHAQLLPQVDPRKAGVNEREPLFLFHKPKA
jgi:SAM-dependent methyltransferase